jgi:hypothetical protein
MKNKCTNLIVQMAMYLFLLHRFNATFNNISAISWQSVLLVEENGETLPYDRDSPINPLVAI